MRLHWLRRRYVSLLSLCELVLFLNGCANVRYTAEPVADKPQTPDQKGVATQNRYRIDEYLIRKDSLNKSFNLGDFKVAAAKAYPGVFGIGGIPISIREEEVVDQHVHFSWGSLAYLVSLGVWPAVIQQDYTERFVVEAKDDSIEPFDFTVFFRIDQSVSFLSPLGLLVEAPESQKGPVSFSLSGRIVVNGQVGVAANEVKYSAVAYAVAHKIVELERAGKVRGRTQRASSMGAAAGTGSLSNGAAPPSYRVVSCVREADSDFSYRFVVDVSGSVDSPLTAFRLAQREFRAFIKEDYLETFPSSDERLIYVDFPEYWLKNSLIEGRAVVLAMTVSSLEYDSDTHCGKLSVRINSNQYEEARKYVRKNIETLARDKNIAIVTGEIPPAAKFYLGREEIKDGNILEIEFKTE